MRQPDVIGENLADVARYLAVTPAATRRQPLTLGFEEVAPRHISRYVRFDRVRLAEEATTWCDFDPETGERLQY